MAIETKHHGLLIVLVGPSGVGKSTISRRLEKEMDISYTVSVTTRPKQPGEDQDGKEYEHIDKPEFFRRLDSDKYLEYAQVHGNYYATPKHPALDYLKEGRDVLLEIDVQGAMQVRHHYPDALLIFILPPDEPTLLKRLIDRDRDSPEDINKRFRAAKREIHMAKGSRTFDYMVINDTLDRAVEEIEKIIKHKRAGGI
ncbi:MAG: guanylate kinase [Phycisphaerales bacterium]|jgi:guanylate kinase|nr:guanylate kinase [Phycisphaerales bacterium]